jgi:AcrR family transcriptional regulator
VSITSQPTERPARNKRPDALRNQQALLAAAAVFISSGVDAPIREIAARAGVGTGTIYRYFPTRADLVVAVYRHQVEACAEAGPTLLAAVGSPLAALRQWVGLFVDFGSCGRSQGRRCPDSLCTGITRGSSPSRGDRRPVRQSRRHRSVQ